MCNVAVAVVYLGNSSRNLTMGPSGHASNKPKDSYRLLIATSYVGKFENLEAPEIRRPPRATRLLKDKLHSLGLWFLVLMYLFDY